MTRDDIDGLAGMYNIMAADEYETADHHLPISDFIDRLREHDLPDAVSVVRFEEALTDDMTQDELISVMRDNLNYLNSQRPLPLIQFIVDGEFHERADTFDVEYEGEFYSLRPIFGKNIKKREENWLVSSFRV